MRRLDWHRSLAVAGLLVLAASSLAQAQKCAVCQEKITDSFYWITNAALPERQAVCQACKTLPTVCATCRLPVKRDFLKLEDGRRLCPLHARDAILTLGDAEVIFTETKREMMRLLRGCGSTPDRNITVSLVDAPELEKLSEQIRDAASPTNTVGLTRTRQAGPEFAHSIYLLSGQGRARLMAVSAHEYTHAWMNENVPSDRRLDHNTVEGFCELAAYKVMSDLKEDREKQFILANAYTEGQTAAFVNAEDTLHFYRVVQWIKSGAGARLDSTNLAGLLALKPEPAFVPAWGQTAPTKVPDTLQLKAISGRPGRWLALVNDRTFEAGETGRVRVGATNVMVRCVSVADNSAIIELLNSGKRQELKLRSP
jgi:hypothetical protein